jgi:cobalt/nickel transport system permease protein
LYPAVAGALSGTPVKPLLSRLAVALPFALFIGLSNLILARGAAFRVGGVIVTYGMLSFASIMLKTAFCVYAVLLLIATTPFADISALLTRAKPLRVVGLQIVLTFRYIGTLLGEAEDMTAAYHLRAPGQKGIAMKHVGTFLGQLLLRSFDRAETVYQAMKCRGFDGVYYGTKRTVFRKSDAVYAVVCAAAIAAMRFFNISELMGTFAGTFIHA